MDSALSIVEGRDGILRDIYGRPMVMIYDSDLNRALARDAKKNASSNGPKDGSESLVFIDTAEPKPKDNAARKLIRTQVMKNFNRKKRQPIRKSQSKKQSHAGDLHKETDKASFEQTYNPFWPTAFPQQPSGSLDAFARYPVPMRPHMYRLIHHYLSVVAQNMYPKEPCGNYGPGQPDLFALALTSPALFHMIICSSAIYMDVYSGRPESRESQLHKLEAIQCLSDSMKESSGISDASIGAVAYLAKIEFTLGNHDMWAIHRNGLIKMIELRGGIEKLSILLQGKLLMTDLAGCVETDSPPYFPLVDIFDIVYEGRLKIQVGNLSNGFRNIASIFSLSSHLVEILDDVQSLTLLLTKTGQENLPSHQRGIDHFATELRYRLLTCRAPETYFSETALIGELCRLSAFLHLKTILWAFPSRGRTYQTIIGKLRTVIETSELLLDSTPEFLLWILFVGAVASYDNPNQFWFVSKIASLTSSLNLRIWDEAKPILNKFWWLESIYERPSLALWNEVMLLRSTPSADHYGI